MADLAFAAITGEMPLLAQSASARGRGHTHGRLGNDVDPDLAQGVHGCEQGATRGTIMADERSEEQ